MKLKAEPPRKAPVRNAHIVYAVRGEVIPRPNKNKNASLSLSFPQKIDILDCPYESLRCCRILSTLVQYISIAFCGVNCEGVCLEMIKVGINTQLSAPWAHYPAQYDSFQHLTLDLSSSSDLATFNCSVEHECGIFTFDYFISCC